MTQYAPGRLVIERLQVPPGQPVTRGEGGAPLPFASIRLRVTAEAVPLSRFGAALAEALRFGVVVSPDVFDIQVSMAWTDVTADRLLAALQSTGIAHRMDIEQTAITLHWWSEPVADVQPRTPGCCCLEVPETRILPLPPQVAPAEVARYFCEHLATDRGYADVVGGQLVLHDVTASLNQVEMLVQSLVEAPTRARRE
jgi:hypothetical protein